MDKFEEILKNIISCGKKTVLEYRLLTDEEKKQFDKWLKRRLKLRSSAICDTSQDES